MTPGCHRVKRGGACIIKPARYTNSFIEDAPIVMVTNTCGGNHGDKKQADVHDNVMGGDNRVWHLQADDRWHNQI